LLICQSLCIELFQVRLWWVEVPKSLPLPAVFVGIDVFHAPVVYDPRTKQKGRKSSVAAIIIQVIDKGTATNTEFRIYTKSFRKEGGQEYELGDALKETMREAIHALSVKPASVIVWRDGIAETAISQASEEIAGVRAGLSSTIVGTEPSAGSLPPLAYIVCQKRISTKLLTRDGKHAAPSGTMVSTLQGLQHQTFYINGRAPPFSTSKPVRFFCVERDSRLNSVPLGALTWSQCHDYPNWAGPVKVPAVCQMAHKLAELAGGMFDGGESIDAQGYTNRVHFL
jgi:hypothetical protein